MNGRTVLVVDDDKALLEAVTRVLRGAGYEVQSTRDGRAVMDMIRRQRPDVVITDIMMPDRDGVEVINEIRKSTRGIRVLAMSGRRHLGSLDLLAMAQKLGADAALHKPFEGDELLAAIEPLFPPRPG
ncbi:response regulator transcription factor [uncultured Phenylobacterium sp.]|uniref:response regulator transcription factor n=1 Tax=uncultured Phenylobacterium sp. TaxID=349273 RepID=UPI0025FD26F3|nr:response regulator [uncultured Phenylobacterium sp.]